MGNLNYKYHVALSETTSAEDLESLLNEKAEQGWELFMLHEVDDIGGRIKYNCVFHKIDEDEELEYTDGENVEITDITDFKNQIEKIYSTKDNYDQFLEIQHQIVSTQKEIKKVKADLENSDNDDQKILYNDMIQEKISFLEELKRKSFDVSDSFHLYNRIKSDKITIYLSEELIRLTEKDYKDNLVARIIKLRQDIADKIGFVIPNIKYSDSIELEPYQYRIDIRDVPSASGFVYPDHIMYYQTQINFARRPKGIITAVDPIYLMDVYWIKEEETDGYWEKGLSTSDLIASNLSYTCIKLCNELIDYNDINNFIDIVKRNNMHLVENLVPEIVSVSDLRYILASLIKEMVSIKDITFIFEKIMDCYNYALEKEIILDKVRVALKRQIIYSRVDDNNSVYVIAIDSELDNYLKEKVIVPENTDSFIDLSKDEIKNFLTCVADMLREKNVKTDNCFLVTSNTVRSALFLLVEAVFPGLSVISHEELVEEVDIKEIGVLTKQSIKASKKKNK